VTTDLPADVQAVLDQLLAESRAAFREGDVTTGLSTVTSASTVATTKLPEGDLQDHLRHGCARVEAVATDEQAGAAVAAEYVAAMIRRFDAASG
jgi:hypothetical protein